MAIQVVIAGMGSRGQDWLREIRKTSAFEVAGFVDSDAEALRRASLSSGVSSAYCYSNIDRALDQTLCQAVIVATPANCHVETCQAALARRLGVLVEKPFTLRLKEAVGLVELAKQNQAPLLVAQNYRYLRSFRTALRLVSEGSLGRVGNVIWQYYRVPHQMAPSLSSLTHSVLWGVGVHHLDALRYILGKKVTGVLAESFTLPWGDLPPGASMRVMLSFEGDIRAFYSATYESSGHEYFEGGQEFYGRFVGERATLHLFHRWLVLCQHGKLPRIIRRGPRKITEEGILLQQFSEAIVDGAEPPSSGRDNLQTMAIVEACLRSTAERSWTNPQELLNGYL